MRKSRPGLSFSLVQSVMSDQPEKQTGASPDGDEIPVDKASADIAIVCSHAAELRPLIRRLDRVRKYTDRNVTFRGGFLDEVIRVAVVEASGSFAAQRRATETLINNHRPTWIISAGLSSALNDTLKAGDLTLATEIVDTHGNSRTVKCPIPATRRVHIGRHVVADERPRTHQEKARLAAESGALAVDLTSLAVAQVCAETGTRFLSIRAIADEFSEEIPDHAAEMMFSPGSRAIGKALGVVLKGMKHLSELREWRTRFAAAADHLDRFTSGVILRIADNLPRQKP